MVSHDLTRGQTSKVDSLATADGTSLTLRGGVVEFCHLVGS